MGVTFTGHSTRNWPAADVFPLTLPGLAGLNLIRGTRRAVLFKPRSSDAAMDPLHAAAGQ